MKKTYITPSLTVISLEEGGVICTSVQVGGNNKVTNENQVLSTSQGAWTDIWDSPEPQTEPKK